MTRYKSSQLHSQTIRAVQSFSATFPHAINYGDVRDIRSYENSAYCNGLSARWELRNCMNDFRKALSRIVIVVQAGIMVTSGVAGSTLLKNHSLEVQTTSQSSSSYSSQTTSSVESSTTSTSSSSIASGSSTSTPTSAASTSSATSTITTTLITSPNVGVQNEELAPDFPITFVDESASQSLYDLQGTPVLLWFVATWCISCQQGAHEFCAKRVQH